MKLFYLSLFALPLFFVSAYAADPPAAPVPPAPQPARPRGPNAKLGDFTVDEMNMIRLSNNGVLPPYDYLHNYVRGLSGYYDLPWVAFDVSNDTPPRVRIIGYNEGGKRLVLETVDQLRVYYTVRGVAPTNAQLA